MEADTEYEVTVFLDKLYDDLKKGMEKKIEVSRS